MAELLVLCFMLIPQTVAGMYAKTMGRNFWFWFFISFLIPIISLIVLVFWVKEKKARRVTGLQIMSGKNRMPAIYHKPALINRDVLLLITLAGNKLVQKLK